MDHCKISSPFHGCHYFYSAADWLNKWGTEVFLTSKLAALKELIGDDLSRLIDMFLTWYTSILSIG